VVHKVMAITSRQSPDYLLQRTVKPQRARGERAISLCARRAHRMAARRCR